MATLPMPAPALLARLRAGTVIPAHPLALTRERKLDERRQRALTRYYLAAGAGGIAVGVHTTQFAIREVGLYRPVLELAREEARGRTELPITIAGISGSTQEAVREVTVARDLGYDIALVSLARLRDATDDTLFAHVAAIAEILPVFGFYLQPAVGGRPLSFRFWRRLVEIANLVAIKIAPFDRYKTLDVMRAVAESGRAGDIALYTGNDDSIVVDLVTEYRFGGARQRIAGGLLGHWAVWTRRAVELLDEIHSRPAATVELLARGAEITDANAAFFDAANGYRGSIAGIHEVLRRQGLLEGVWCLDPDEGLSPGQREEIDRVHRSYPHLNDDAFVASHLDEWLR
jgi:dihydrodipicolinate synthase/N-acetylneuraminate lyase